MENPETQTQDTDTRHRTRTHKTENITPKFRMSNADLTKKRGESRFSWHANSFWFYMTHIYNIYNILFSSFIYIFYY